MTVIFIALAIVPMVTQLILYKEVFDPLWPKKTSVNVVAVRKPKGEVKRRIILNGHADATWEWTILYKYGFNAFKAVFLGAVAGVLYYLTIAVISIIAEGLVMDIPGTVFLILGLSGLIFMPFWIALIWFSDEKTIVDGANDNLTGCYVSMAAAKSLKEEGVELENTELMVVLSGSEEAGLRGAKRFAAAHQELKDIETIIIPFETIREKDHLSVFRRDLNMTVKADEQLVSFVQKAAKNAGVDLPASVVELGSTDAAAFAGGFKAVCIAEWTIT